LDLTESLKYALAVGTIEPRKNLSLLLQLWKKNDVNFAEIENLIIVGKYGWKSRALRKQLNDPTSDLLWIDSCCDGALRLYYERAKMFVNLSFNEGFDMPSHEAALIFRLPLILSNIPVHREFFSDAIYLDPKSGELISLPADSESRPDELSEFKDFLSSAVTSID
jgi:glycosyltransferase involved in cell wall biosynthesis